MLNPDHKKMYERVSAMAKIGVWECDLDTEELTWADAVYDLFDMPRGSKVERDAALSCYEPTSRRELELLRSEAIKNGAGFKLDINILTPKGNLKWIRITADIEQEQGRSVRIFGTKQDISEERLAQERANALKIEVIHLARLNEMGIMAITLAHELNQPLAAIVNYAEGAKRLKDKSGGERSDLTDALSGISGAAHRAGDLLKSLRNLTTGRGSQSSHFDLRAACEECIRLVAIVARPAVEIIDEIPAGVTLDGDRIQVQQVLSHVIRNACQAVQSSDDRIIKISAIEKSGQIVVCVADKGPGFSAEATQTLFTFAESTKKDGMGIGLSICRTILEIHGGRIWLERSDENGTEMRFSLPLAVAEKPDIKKH